MLFPQHPNQISESLQNRINTLIEKLEETYPDHVISGLSKDHKRWSESVTEFYKACGYPDNRAFLEAYGFTVEEAKGGRPGKVDPDQIIAELKTRYPGGFDGNFARLKEANPDLPLKTFMNNAKNLFGMPVGDYLESIGIMINRKSSSRYALDILRERYPNGSGFSDIVSLKAANPDLQINLSKPELISAGILKDKANESAQKHERLIQEIRELYPDGKFPTSLQELASDHPELKLSGLTKKAAMEAGILRSDTMSREEFDELTELILERSAFTYAAYFKNLADAYTDLPMNQYDKYCKKYTGTSANAYLSALGIIEGQGNSWGRSFRGTEMLSPFEARQLLRSKSEKCKDDNVYCFSIGCFPSKPSWNSVTFEVLKYRIRLFDPESSESHFIPKETMRFIWPLLENELIRIRKFGFDKAANYFSTYYELNMTFEFTDPPAGSLHSVLQMVCEATDEKMKKVTRMSSKVPINEMEELCRGFSDPLTLLKSTSRKIINEENRFYVNGSEITPEEWDHMISELQPVIWQEQYLLSDSSGSSERSILILQADKHLKGDAVK